MALHFAMRPCELVCSRENCRGRGLCVILLEVPVVRGTLHYAVRPAVGSFARRQRRLPSHAVEYRAALRCGMADSALGARGGEQRATHVCARPQVSSVWCHPI
jgi:hypothetical protein